MTTKHRHRWRIVDDKTPGVLVHAGGVPLLYVPMVTQECRCGEKRRRSASVVPCVEEVQP